MEMIVCAGAYFCLDMPKIDSKLLHQAGLILVTFCAECGKPARPQSHVLAHPTGDVAHLTAEGCWGAAIVAV